MIEQVEILVPVYRLPLTEGEEVSLKHLFKFLGHHRIVLIAPTSLEIRHPALEGLPVERFHDDYFQGTADYNRLMLSREFYRRFEGCEFVLIYQLDCLVFSDELAHWCAQRWDYLGAPWFRGFRDDVAKGLWAVGNGGLSLRRVSKFLEVLNSRRRGPAGPTKFHFRPPWVQRAFLRVKDFAYACGYKSTVDYVVKKYTWNEDGFWSFEARNYAPDFAVPSPEEALGFAFEYAPRYCYELNQRRLPFGCHAWLKTDPDFWEPYLLRSPEKQPPAGSAKTQV